MLAPTGQSTLLLDGTAIETPTEPARGQTINVENSARPMVLITCLDDLDSVYQRMVLRLQQTDRIGKY